MAFGRTEDPGLSPMTQVDGVEYPVWREQLAKIASDNGASTDVINLLKSLPRSRYDSKQEVMRDFAEAARRFATGNLAADEDEVLRDRRNIGKDAVEQAPGGMTRHP